MRAPLLRFFLAILLILPGAAAPAGETTPTQRQEIESIIHDYFLAHPEFMVEVLRAAEAKVRVAKEEGARQAITAKRQELLQDANAPFAGNPEGDVTVVEFFDYRCPYCKQVEPVLDRLIKEDPKIRLVYKEFPVLGADSVYATRMALAARRQGKYAPFHEAMMATKGQISEETIVKVARSVGIDVDKAKADMQSPEIDDIIKRNYALAEALDIQGTPAFIIGNALVPGATDIAKLKQLIADARKSG
jgi:protein-disulfide isomerase